MFLYNLRLSMVSLWKDKLLTGLMILAVGLGIGLSMTILTVHHMLSSDPIPEKSAGLYVVRLDSWDPLEPFREPNVAPYQVTYQDVMTLRQSDIPLKQAAMFKSGFVIQPENKSVRPYQVLARVTDGDFFSLFNVPFLYGSAWQPNIDNNAEQVVILGRETNEKVFGGENSVGRTIRMDEYYFRVVGVLDTWQPAIKFYDVNNGPFDEPEEVFIPFSLTPSLELPSWGNNNGWKGETINSYQDKLNSESIWIQYWAELRQAEDVSSFKALMDSHVMEQKKLGRFPRPLNNQLTPLMSWLEERKVVGEETQVLLALAFMFLMVCLLNVVGLILAKFSGKSAEISIRRALGADKTILFTQHIIESGVVGSIGGLSGLIFAFLGLSGISILLPDLTKMASMDMTMVVFTILLSICCTILAGIYPTWRVCQIQPANYLKTQ